MFQYKILYKLIDLRLILKEIYKIHIAMKHAVHKTVDKIANTKHTHVLKLRVYFQWGPTSQLKNTPVARKIRNSFKKANKGAYCLKCLCNVFFLFSFMFSFVID